MAVTKELLELSVWNFVWSYNINILTNSVWTVYLNEVISGKFNVAGIWALNVIVVYSTC